MASKQGSNQGMYGPEFKRQIVDLVGAGETPEELARRFEPSAQSIRNWVKQDKIDKRQIEGVSTDERAELKRLRQRVAQLEEEQAILGKALGWFARRDGSIR